MIGTCKTSFAYNAFEWFSASVFTIMPCQFIGTCKTPFTIWPLTHIWFFTYGEKKEEITNIRILNLLKVMLNRTSNKYKTKIKKIFEEDVGSSKSGKIYWNHRQRVYPIKLHSFVISMVFATIGGLRAKSNKQMKSSIIFE